MKICSKCNIEQTLDQFNKKKSNKDGLTSYCKSCHKKVNQKHYRLNIESYKASKNSYKLKYKNIWIKYKSNLVCEYCGENRHWCLDFHHTDPTKKDDNIALMIANGRPFNVIFEEVKKCIPVCKNCHADIHYKLHDNIGS